MKGTPRPASIETEKKLEEQIRRRAYELYEARGRENGHDLEDWLHAEIDIAECHKRCRSLKLGAECVSLAYQRKEEHSMSEHKCKALILDSDPDALITLQRTVKGMFLVRRCVQSSFTAADEKLALSLYRRHVPLIHVEHAILLGAAREYTSWLEHGQGAPISSLHYFTDLFREVQQEITPHYWTYIAHKVKTFEQTWTGFASRGAEANKNVAEGQSGGMLRVDRVGNRRS